MIQVREVRTRKEQKIFAGLHEKMYRDVPGAIPELLSDEMDNFNPQKNPAYEFCQVKQWIAWRDGAPVGRVAGIINQAANEKWGNRRIRFTRLDFEDDPAVSQALLHAVEEWGRSQGLTEIHGPIGFCDMDQEGMLVEGFEEEGMLITIHNAPYYPAHMEALGYRKDVDWLEFQIQVPEKKWRKCSGFRTGCCSDAGCSFWNPRASGSCGPMCAKHLTCWISHIKIFTVRFL